MDLTDYANAALKPPEEFLRRFFSTVVKDDPYYYERIGALLFGIVTPDRVLLTDLCRASFVRPDPDRLGQVKGGDKAVEYDRKAYDAYVKDNEDWTWQRMKQCAGGVIVTLGDIAEKGLLAMFRRQGYTLSIPTAPLPRDHLHPGVRPEPLRHRLGHPIREQGHRLPALQVHQDRAIRVPFPQGEIVHP